MTPEQFRLYETEIVGAEAGAHGRLAALLRTPEVSVKRYATGGRDIPAYIAQSLRAIVLLHRAGKIKQLFTLP